MQAFAFLGIVESRHGEGSYLIRNPQEIPLEFSRFTLALEEYHLLELSEIRKILEPELAALAAKKATDEDIEAIDKAFHQYREVESTGKSTDDKTRDKVTRNFHRAIAEASGNNLAVILLDKIKTLMAESDLVSYRGRIRGGFPYGLKDTEHGQILDAIKARDPEAAKLAMYKHLTITEQTIKKALFL